MTGDAPYGWRVTPLPPRLAAVVIVFVVAGGLSLYQGLTSDGQNRVVYTLGGAMAIGCALLVCVGWWRGTSRR